MKIIIFIATFNSEKTIGECLDSLLRQSYKNFLVFIKDGGSSDNTIHIIEGYKKLTDKIQYLTSRDRGVYDAWNSSLNNVEGDWITFLGSDDFFADENSLRFIVKELEFADIESISLVYGKNIIVDEQGGYMSELGDNWIIAKENIYRRMTIRHPGCFCKLSLIKNIGGFDDSFKIVGDYDFVLNALKLTDFHFYNFPAVCHRVGGLSTSPSRLLEVIKETYILRKKHNLKPYLYADEVLFKRLVLYFLSIFVPDYLLLKLLKRVN